MRQSLAAQRVGRDWRCPDQLMSMSSYVCAIGISNPQAPPHWRFAGWASMNLPIAPPGSSYPVLSQISARRCLLDQLTLLVFPKTASPWTLKLQFPAWHLLINLEVWQYNGSDIDELTRLDEIEAILSES